MVMQDKDEIQPLKGPQLIFAAILLAIANFIVVLDTTIANVSVSHIAGSLGIAIDEGTYVITSYAVAEAIAVPLTGWLASRFGTVRVFVNCIMLFGLFSALCGFSTSLFMLNVSRVLQGLAGGPLMPLSQTLLMSIFPADKRGSALGLWSVTTLLAPISGPIIGGFICDNYSWHYIFLINVPVVVICSFFIFNLLKRFETKIMKLSIDYVGMILLAIWVGCLQMMLDEGKNKDWFESNYILSLAISAAFFFVSFIIWECTHENPIVDLKVFRHPGYTYSVITLSLTFGAYFASIVILPLWLQNYMNYDATNSGFIMSKMGCVAIFVAPIVAKLSTKYDGRVIVFIGVFWLGLCTMYRSFASTDLTFQQISIPLLIQGVGLPLFFIPLTSLALSSVKKEETASAAGLMSFLRTSTGAFATSIITTSWDNEAKKFRQELVEHVQEQDFLLENLSNIVQQQAVVLATNKIFFMVSIAFMLAAFIIFLAPKAQNNGNTTLTH